MSSNLNTMKLFPSGELPTLIELACVASVSVRFSARSRHFLFFSRAKIGASAKKCVTGEGKGEKETLARKPHNFEKPVRPRTEFPDWRGMVVLIAK